MEPGVAILADTWWQAQSARKSLKVDWDYGRGASQNSDDFAKRAAELLKSPPANTVRNYGDVDGALEIRRQSRRGRLRLSVPGARHPGAAGHHRLLQRRQDRDLDHQPDARRGPRAGSASRWASIPPAVKVHMCRVGGGFGRRLMNDYMVEAAWLSKAGRQARQACLVARRRHRPRRLSSRRHHGPESRPRRAGQSSWPGASTSSPYGEGKTIVQCGDIDGDQFPAGRVANFSIGMTAMPLWLRTGALRAPGVNAYGFVDQSFLDELANAAGRDPLDLQLEILSATPAPDTKLDFNDPDVLNPERMKGVLELVAEKSGWASRKKTPGRGMGHRRRTSAISATSPKWPT